MQRNTLVFLLLIGCDPAPVAPPDPVTVFAASSLKEVVTELTGTARLQFEASSTLARQIKEGAGADVFISAAPEWLDAVKPLDRYDWLGNRLVCVVPKDAPDVDLEKLESLSLANESVPAGKYARAALAHEGIKIPERTIYGSNVRDVLSKVSQGGAQAGIVYATDAAIDPAVRIAHTFPPESHPRIVYSVGLLTPQGKAVFDHLRSPGAIDAAKKKGLTELK